jgi:hypothetical protein
VSGLLRRLRPALERLLGVTDDVRSRLGWLLGRWLTLPTLRDGQELGDALRQPSGPFFAVRTNFESAARLTRAGRNVAT